MGAAATRIAERVGKRQRKIARRVPLALVVPPVLGVRPMPTLQSLERRGPVLRPAPYLEPGPDLVCGLNLTAGCAHACSFCFVRAYPGYPGDDTLIFYPETAEQLRRELHDRRRRPRAVYLSPSSDPFPPFAEVQREFCQVLEVLAEFGIEGLVMTRGFIRPMAIEALTAHRSLVRVTVAVTTLDSNLRRLLEGLAAPPRLRIKQVAELRRRSVPVEVSLEPLMPGLTDTAENLEPLLDALAATGVDRITAGYLYLRHGIRENLVRELGPNDWAEPMLEAFVGGPVLPMGPIAPAKHLPRVYRQRGYARLMSLAAARGITVRLNGLTNPDFTPPRPARAAETPKPPRQLGLPFENEENSWGFLSPSDCRKSE